MKLILLFLAGCCLLWSEQTAVRAQSNQTQTATSTATSAPASPARSELPPQPQESVQTLFVKDKFDTNTGQLLMSLMVNAAKNEQYFDGNPQTKF